MQPVTIPSRDEIARRIEACREELAALKQLDKLAVHAEIAERARRVREGQGVDPEKK